MTSNSYAQDEKHNQNIENKDEIKINAIYLLAGMPEVTYERILDEDSAIGVSAAVALVKDPIYDFMITPYYRLYFGKETASGFFMELNASFYSEEINRDYDEIYVEDESGGGYYTSFKSDAGSELGLGLGLSVGVKLELKKDWFGEIFGGAGRNFLSIDKISSLYPRGGLTIGKRF